MNSCEYVVSAGKDAVLLNPLEGLLYLLLVAVLPSGALCASGLDPHLSEDLELVLRALQCCKSGRCLRRQVPQNCRQPVCQGKDTCVGENWKH